MKTNAWLRFFRVSSLATAAGDAAAGGALAFAVIAGPDALGAISPGPTHFANAPTLSINPMTPAVVTAFFAAAAAELLLCLFGLADNEIADAKTDGPDHPIPAGEISLLAARIARAVCLAAALAVGAAARLSPLWWEITAGLVALVLVFNHLKWRLKGNSYFIMGACRGLALLAGTAAVLPPAGGKYCAACSQVVWTAALPAALVWAVYAFAVMRIGEDAEHASKPLGAWRYPLGFAALLPAVAAGGALVCSAPTDSPVLVVASLAAFANWCAAVAPLGRPHGPAERRRAVAQALGALLWMQTGLMLLNLQLPFIALAVALWAYRFVARVLWPDARSASAG